MVDARELSAGFPPPRDDEPPSLRQDIIDELADHLHGALRRELLAAPDVDAARERVIDRFGDPRQIARTLWTQAMWSKIMSQRFMLAAMGLMTVVCLALTGVAAWSMQQQRSAAAQQQQVLAEMMERLARLAEAKASPGTGAAATPPAPSSIRVQLMVGSPDGPPAADHRVVLRQLGFDQEKTATGHSNEKGVADFGYCDVGRYEFTVRTPSGFTSPVSQFVLNPYTAYVAPVVCPPDSEEVNVSITATIPEDLRKFSVRAFVGLNPGTVAQGDHAWKELSNPRYLLVDSDGWEIVYSPQERLVSERASNRELSKSWIISRFPFQQADHRFFAGARYSTKGVRLVLPGALPSGREPAARRAPTSYEQIVPKPDLDSEPFNLTRGVQATHPLDLEFVAEPGKLNEWVIPVPEELIQQAREFLKENPRPSPIDE